MHQLGLYWQTLRYLKPIQVYGRLRFRLLQPRPDLRPAPPPRALAGCWVPGAVRARCQVGPSRFRFLGVERDLTDGDWDDKGIEKLWRYNLNYFDDLVAFDAVSRRAWHVALIARWIRENPPGGGTAWEPYPTSLRIVNWIKWAWQGEGLDDTAAHSLAIQARWLAKRLEFHLQGNHLFANAKALVFAGLFFVGPEADEWTRRGVRILLEQLPEQVLPDGGQFERSPMYHAIALEDVLDLINAISVDAGRTVASQALSEALRAVVMPMRRWLLTMCHPDGEIAQFNDAAIGIAPPPMSLDDYARRLGFPGVGLAPGLSLLQDSGYARYARGAAVALMDVGPLGPDYLPAHAHADTLSFELSVCGQRLLVNSGTSVYAAGPERSHQRSTAAHNTVLVDGADSSEVWAAFRVGRRARPLGLTVSPDGEPGISCGHNGYHRLAGRPTHWREWRFQERGLTVTDRIDGPFKQAQARFHLHPAIRIDEAGPEGATVTLPNGERIHLKVAGGRCGVESTNWHRGFGVREPNSCIVVEFEGPEVRTDIAWNAI